MAIKFFLVFSLIFFLIISPLGAVEPFVFSSIRSLGMGGVSITIPNEEWTLYANPAGLAYVEKTNWDIICGSAVLDAKTYATGRNISSHFNDQQNSFEKMLTLAALAENNGGAVSLGFQVNSLPLPIANYTKKNFGWGVFGQGYSEVKIANNPGPQITAEGSYETAAIVGGAWPVSPDISLGINLKYLGRIGTYDRNTQSRVYQLSNQNIFDGNYNINGIWGSGPAIDLGGLMTFEADWGKNYLGLVGYNVVGKLFGATTSANQFIDNFFDLGPYTPEPSQKYNEKVPATVVMGWSTFVKNDPFREWLFSAEYPLTRRQESIKNFKFGAEKKLDPKGPIIRGGYNQGALSLGASFDVSKDIRFDYAYILDPIKNYFWHAFEIRIIGR